MIKVFAILATPNSFHFNKTKIQSHFLTSIIFLPLSFIINQLTNLLLWLPEADLRDQKLKVHQKTKAVNETICFWGFQNFIRQNSHNALSYNFHINRIKREGKQ
jgi:hypothetical protein